MDGRYNPPSPDEPGEGIDADAAPIVMDVRCPLNPHDKSAAPIRNRIEPPPAGNSPIVFRGSFRVNDDAMKLAKGLRAAFDKTASTKS